jgi:zinc/manganese transport system substrate-binding protein
MLLAALLVFATPAQAALQVFACEPEWAALAAELGGEDVSVHSATHALQDAHRVEARPSLIARARRADLVVCTGADLEVAWLPLVLRQAANARVMPGRPGYFEAARFVERLEIPEQVDRSMGDVHPGGNPHIHTDPRRLLPVAEALSERLAQLDPEGADRYAARHAAFAERWRSAIAGWAARAEPLRGLGVVTDHKAWVYLFDWLGLVEIGTLEPKPGLPASAGHLAALKRTVEAQDPRMILLAAYQDPKGARWLNDQTGLPVAELPYTVGGNAQADDLFALYENTIDILLATAGLAP